MLGLSLRVAGGPSKEEWAGETDSRRFSICLSDAKLVAVLKALAAAPSPTPLTNGHASTPSSTFSPFSPPTTSIPIPAATATEEPTLSAPKSSSLQFGSPLASDLPPPATTPTASGTVSPAPWASHSTTNDKPELAFGTTAGEEPKKDVVEEKEAVEVPVVAEPVGVKGLEGEGEGLAEEADLFAEEQEEQEKEEEEEEETLKETEEEKAEAKDEVKVGSLGGAAIAVRSPSTPRPRLPFAHRRVESLELTFFAISGSSNPSDPFAFSSHRLGGRLRVLRLPSSHPLLRRNHPNDGHFPSPSQTLHTKEDHALGSSSTSAGSPTIAYFVPAQLLPQPAQQLLLPRAQQPSTSSPEARRRVPPSSRKDYRRGRSRCCGG